MLQLIRDYIDQYDGEVLERLERIYETVFEQAPSAEEAFVYDIPTFRLHGKNLLHFAAYESHIGLYPGAEAIEHFKSQIPYPTSKGTVQFPHDQPMPYELIRDMTEYCVERLR